MAKGGASDFADLGAQPLGAADFSDLQSEPMRDGPNAPAQAQDSPDDTMKYLAKMAKAIYGSTPAGMAQLAGKFAMETGAESGPAVGQHLSENADVMAGAGMGAYASLPLAPAAGPFAPLVPIAGAITGAVATRAAVRPLQAALGRPGPAYATSEDLAQAAKEGALQEVGGQIITKAIPMGVAGARALKGKAIAKAKELLPDFEQIMLRVPSEAINRTMERFPKFSNSLKSVFSGPRREAQAKAGNMAEIAYNHLDYELVRGRKISGVRVERAENEFITKMGNQPIADVGDIAKGLKDWRVQNPAASLKGDYDKLVAEVESIIPNMTPGAASNRKGWDSTMAGVGRILHPQYDPRVALTAKAGIQLRRALDRLSTFSKGGVRPIESDAVERLTKDLATELRKLIRGSAEKLGGRANYAKRLAEFSKMADEYDDAIEILKVSSNSERSIGKKITALAGEFNKGGPEQSAILNIGRNMRGNGRITDAVERLADALAVKGFTEVPVHVPSGLILRILNVMVPSRSIMKGIATAVNAPAKAPYVMGPTGKAGSRLAAALAAQQTRE